MLGDPSRLLSVIENLLDNAVKATREGQGISIRTSLERDREHRGNWVQLGVSSTRDTGSRRINSIRSSSPASASRPSGFGLGLSLCREIVRMHGGTIEVASQPGRTVFRIRLPQFRSGEGDDSNSLDPAG